MIKQRKRQYLQRGSGVIKYTAGNTNNNNQPHEPAKFFLNSYSVYETSNKFEQKGIV